jgi:hypothetical protein
LGRHGLGDIERCRGRLDPVLASYRAAQSSADRLAKADPGNADWQRVSKKNGETATALVGQSWCPKGLDALSYASGYIEGEAQRAKRPLRAISSPKARKDAP